MSHASARTPAPRDRRRRTRRLAAIAAIALAAAVPASASADSIAYLKEGDVWLATTDGARQFRVTHDGGWQGVSQSDNGVLVGAKDRRLFRLARTGQVLNEITTGMGSPNWNGPYDIAVSPDGTRVAYGFLYQRVTVDPDCPFTPSQCASTSVFSGVGYSNTDGPASGVEMHTGWSYPTWVDDSLLMHSDPDGVLNEDVILRPFGSPNNTGTQWFSHDEIPRLRDGDIRGRVMAFIGGHAGEILTVWRHSGERGDPAGVEGCLAYGQPTGGRFSSPSLAPGGRTMVWGEGDGVWTDELPDLDAGCAPPSGNARLLIPGGSTPDWGGGDVPVQNDPPRPPDNPGGDGPGPGDDGPGADDAPSAATVALAGAKPRLRKAIRRGLEMTVRNATGTVRVVARVNKRTARRAGLGRKAVTVAQGTAQAEPGATRVRLRFTPRAAKALKRTRRVRLAVGVVGSDARTKLTLVR